MDRVSIGRESQEEARCETVLRGVWEVWPVCLREGGVRWSTLAVPCLNKVQV